MISQEIDSPVDGQSHRLIIPARDGKPLPSLGSRDYTCSEHMRSILSQDKEYAERFGIDKAREFLTPDDSIQRMATFLIGLHQSNKEPKEPEINALNEVLSRTQVHENIFKLARSMVSEDTMSYLHHRFERRSHISFLRALGIKKRTIYESQDRSLIIKNRQIARPILAEIVRFDDSVLESIAQVSYRDAPAEI